MSTYKLLTIDQGSTFGMEMYVTANDGSVFNLTDCTVSGQIREYAQSESATTEFTGIIVGNPTEGHIMLSLTDEETALLTHRRYVFDIIIENSVNQKYRIAEGIIEVSPSVTRTV
jgi:hypothetical protein